jgi:hypothetical protein
LGITFLSYSPFLAADDKALPKMLFFLIELVAYRLLELLFVNSAQGKLLLDVADI